MLKKIAYILIFCMIFGAVATLSSCNNEADSNFDTIITDFSSDSESDSSVIESDSTDSQNPEEKKQSIDIYIIAGQSNATGHTKYNQELLASLWSDYKIGSSNVLYRGVSEYTINVNTPEVSTGVNEFSWWTKAKAGQGKSTEHMGAEVGMAAALSSTYYTGDNVCGIIKYAHGGTSIFNNTSGENAANGNWVSPSYANSKGWNYSGLTGNLYRNLISEVKESIEQLGRFGYNDINIKGVFWMQGESDRGNPKEYKVALEYLIKDLRKDLGLIVDEDLSDLAIMIGEISRTSGSASESTVALNETFIEMQRSVAAEMDNVYTIASSKFEINWLLENGENKNGQDSWHWTTEHMFRIGELVAQCILENILKP